MSKDLIEVNCPHCNRLVAAKNKTLENFVLETENSIVIAGDHQFFPGYCVVIAKIHIREMHHMPENSANKLFQDVMNVGRGIEKYFKPLKMNYVSLGNVDEHLHWHVIPRYLDDPDHKDHPWKNSAKFQEHKTTPNDILTLRKVFLGLR